MDIKNRYIGIELDFYSSPHGIEDFNDPKAILGRSGENGTS